MAMDLRLRAAARGARCYHPHAEIAHGCLAPLLLTLKMEGLPSLLIAPVHCMKPACRKEIVANI